MTNEDSPFRVVVGVDGSEDARAAAEWAVREAAAHRGRLVVAHAWSLPVVAGGPAMFAALRVEDLQASAEDLLTREADQLRLSAPDVDVETRLEYGNPIAVLLDLADDASVVVVGSRGVGRVVGLLLGSVSQAVVTRAPCPVLVVPPPEGKHS